MFEDKTFESIMTEMMADMPLGADTSEGSQLWHACAKMAVRLEEAYGDLDYVWENILEDTQDIEHLIKSGTEAGYPITEATPAVFAARLNISVPQGTVFTHSEEDYNYTVTTIATEPDEEGMYQALMECEEAGADPNSVPGEIEPLEYLEEFEAGELTALIVPGKNQEPEDAYRARRLEFRGAIKPFGGNRAYYIQEISALAGVGGVKVVRRALGEKNIIAIIQAADYGAPTPELVAFVQDRVDPPGQSGEGEGIAPIDHFVLIEGVEALTVNITASVTYGEGYSFADLASQIEAAVDKYFLSLNQSWKANEFLMIRIAHLESEILDIEGIIDITDTALNGFAANIPLGANEIAIKGEIIC
jgi:uncharacterized phage protein gp47/JayE